MSETTQETQFGYTDGDTCRRLVGLQPCDGVIATHPVEGCSCHIAPPCSQCTSPRNYCPSCDWQEKDDQIINDYRVNVDRKTDVFRCWELRPLDPTKIDFHSKPHTHSSMLKTGVYPDGVSREQVEAEVKGTFGGRFNHFGGGKFEYVAYTD